MNTGYKASSGMLGLRSARDDVDIEATKSPQGWHRARRCYGSQLPAQRPPPGPRKGMACSPLQPAFPRVW